MQKAPVLIISPIPSHPQQQGNSARIYRLAQLFQLRGHPIHFIYYGLEGLTQKQESDMSNCWDIFHFIQPHGPTPKPSLDEFYHVDDWYNDRVGALVESLCASWNYVACVVNYVWFSKALELLPDTVLKLIDTHDIFGDRHIVAKEAGLDPVWFYTSTELEAWALKRADVIIAIQEQEAEYFRKICDVSVVTVGYVVPEQVLPSRCAAKSAPLKVGYLGSGNPFNVTSIISFFDNLDPSILSNKLVEFHLAGTICSAVSTRLNERVNHWGIVDDVADFYSEMDLLINPMIGGTGLKIKSVEVLAFGKPLMATKDAMVGICDTSETGVFETTRDMAAAFSDEVGSQIVPKYVWTRYITENIKAFESLCSRL